MYFISNDDIPGQSTPQPSTEASVTTRHSPMVRGFSFAYSPKIMVIFAYQKISDGPLDTRLKRAGALRVY